MTKDGEASKRLLDDAIQSVRQEKLDAALVADASARAWDKIAEELPGREVSQIRSCDDFRSLIPAYLAGQLSEARVLLLEDHVKECVSCRDALEKAQPEKVVLASFRPKSDRTGLWMKLGSIAAALLIGFGLLQMGALESLLPWDTAAVAILQESDGTVFQVLEEGTVPISVEEKILSRQSIRTAKDSGAILELSDGSRVELAPRTELAVLDGWFATTIQLRRGNVIVEAASQGAGSLYVSTDECRVAVKGTVFSVSHGMKGSRVSVIEGEVLIEKGDLNTTLKPGEQFASQPSLSKVSVEDDIAWSQSAEQHVALLGELSAIQKDFHEATFGEELRYSSELLGMLPEGTVVYGAIPNVTGQLGEFYQLLLQRVQENSALREWYQNECFPGDKGVTLDEFVEKMTGFGEFLGDEVVVAIVNQAQGGVAPVVLAHVTDESSLWRMASEEAERLNALSDAQDVIIIIDETASADAGKGLFVLIDDGIMAASPSLPLLEAVAEDNSVHFSTTRFYQQIAASYAEGVDWLLSIDLETFAAAGFGDEETAKLEQLGLTELHGLVVQRRRDLEGVAENRAVLTYEGSEEDGIISWIADPGPIGGLEFVSPDAYLAAAFVMNDPLRMMEGVIQQLEQKDPEAVSRIEQFESEHNISILDDIAAPLGGEIVFAIDGPLLPKPSWKVIVEVYDPQTLQQTIEYLIDEVNEVVSLEGGVGVELLVDSSGGMTVYSLKKADSSLNIEYAYASGYMVIAPDRTLILSAKQSQEARYTLVGSPSFVASLPTDSSVNLSAVFYQNLAPMLNSILSSPVAGSLSSLSPEAEESVKELLGDAKPMLVTVRSEPGQLVLAGEGDLESFWLNLGTLASLGGPDGLARILQGETQVQ